MNNRVINFNAGPSALPESLLEKAKEELMNFDGSGMSVMELSHRSKEFEGVLDRCKALMTEIFAIPDSHEILFLQGGASLQFAMVPMNLCPNGESVDFIQSGSWTKKAYKELQKVASARVVATSEEDNFLRLPNLNGVEYAPDAGYVYCASNNTIFGTQMREFPDTGSVPLVSDMSSDIFSRRVDVNRFGLIFAGAQKNIGPSGLTIVIIKKELADRAKAELPTMLQYRTHIDAGSLYNTPPTFGIYMAKLMMDWIVDQGGLSVIEEQNDLKSRVLYDAIDSNEMFYCPVSQESRSQMNVVFRVKDNNVDLEQKFVTEATAAGLVGLKGHRSVGGLRASIYNAQPLKSIEALIEFMGTFAQKTVSEGGFTCKYRLP